jgi:hypothetical protein
VKTLDRLIEEENSYFANGNWPTEFDQGLNDIQRQKIEVFKEKYGQCWLGRINKKFDDNNHLKEYEGEKVYNFGADFIIPKYDEKLELMIQSYLSNSHESAFSNINDIFGYVHRIGGISFFWV